MAKSSNYKRLFAADGKPMTVIGTIEMTLHIHSLMIPTSFQAMQFLNHEMILGMSFLTQTQTNIDVASGVITLYEGLVGVNLVKPPEALRSTTDEVLIPPMSEAIVPVTRSRRYGSLLPIIEPSVSLSGKQLALARAIVIPKFHRTVCKRLNPTESHVFLKRRAVIPTIQEISIDSVNVIDDASPSIQTSKMTSEQIKVIKSKDIKSDQNSLQEEEYKI